jgi:hypothetical protein
MSHARILMAYKKYKDVEGIHFTGYVEEKDKTFGDCTVVAFPYTSTTEALVLHQVEVL